MSEKRRILIRRKRKSKSQDLIIFLSALLKHDLVNPNIVKSLDRLMHGGSLDNEFNFWDIREDERK